MCSLVVDGRATRTLRVVFGLIGAISILGIVSVAAITKDGLSSDIIRPTAIALGVVTLATLVGLVIGEKILWPLILPASSLNDSDEGDGKT